MNASVRNGEIRRQLDELEDDIERLRIAYEKYFAGIDRIAPARQRELVYRRIQGFLGTSLATTALRFRLRSLRARFVTLSHYWTRVEREIERGVSRRDRLRGRSKAGDGRSGASSSHRGTHTRMANGPASVPPPPTSDASRSDLPSLGIDPKTVRSAFRELVKHKREGGESTAGLSFGAVCRQLVDDARELQAQHTGKALEFDVDVRDGQLRLRTRGP